VHPRSARDGRRPSQREGTARVRTLCYPPGDILVVSGLPGGGKSWLRRERRMAGLLPYAAYRPLVRITHYAGLRQAVRSGASVVVHDRGTLRHVRNWPARQARRSRAACSAAAYRRCCWTAERPGRSTPSPSMGERPGRNGV
jgi:hypothetical protein